MVMHKANYIEFCIFHVPITRAYQCSEAQAQNMEYIPIRAYSRYI